MHDGCEVGDWARAEFGEAELGHWARTKRLVTITRAVAAAPSGRVSQVCASAAEQQGAYDFLEESSVTPEALTRACVAASIKRCAEHPFVFVAIDGSSLTFTDRRHKKELGPIGSHRKGARGLKVMTAYAIDPAGVSLGVTAQSWWTRATSVSPCWSKRTRNAKRKTAEKETQRWIDAIDGTIKALEGLGTRAWFQLDREGDSREVLRTLVTCGHGFTVRSSMNRRLADAPAKYLREHMQQQRVLGTYVLPIVAGPNRTAREARMVLRAASVELRLRDPWTKKISTCSVVAVWARELGTTPSGEKPLDWLLLTNREVASFADALVVVQGYAMRWRIEELHRTWKSGTCRAEDAQLHSTSALIKWSTILVAVATRIERLKQLARDTPDLAATTELQPLELRALILLKRRQKKRTETVSDTPTIGEAVRWIADLGGYTGKSSGGPPGATTISRGLHDVMVAAAAIAALAEEAK